MKASMKAKSDNSPSRSSKVHDDDADAAIASPGLSGMAQLSPVSAMIYSKDIPSPWPLEKEPWVFKIKSRTAAYMRRGYTLVPKTEKR